MRDSAHLRPCSKQTSLMAEPPDLRQLKLARRSFALLQPSNKKAHDRGIFYLVGDEGLEPPTSSLSVTRSNQLS
jgi:hypothetical protein